MKKFLYAYLPVFLICFVLNCWGMYYWMFLSQNITIQTAYLDNASYSEDEKYFLNLEYFSNENGNGIENFGAWLDYYTDTAIPKQNEDGSYGAKYTFSSGVQFKNGYSSSGYIDTDGFTYSYDSRSMRNCQYYNTTENGLSYSATNTLADMDKWVYDVDGQLCLVQEVGNVKESQVLWVKRGKKYDTALMLYDMYNVVKSLPDGEQVITIDLSKYYNVYLYDGKEFDTTNTTSENWVFVNVYVNKTSNGLVSAKQSHFNCYMGDADWSLYDIENEDYWQAKAEYNLSLSDFTFTYENGGYYLKLQTSCIEYLSLFKNMRFLVSLDLDNIYLGFDKVYIDGFSKNAFGELQIDEIKLISVETRDFYVYDKTLNIQHSTNLNIVEVGNV